MKVAVLIPCYNEELTVEKVVKDFRKEFGIMDQRLTIQQQAL